MLGDWDAAEAELTQAADADGLADNEYLACYRGWLAALRGDAAAAETMLAGLPDLRASEDPQDKAHDQHRGGLHRRRPPPAAGRAAAGPPRAGSRRRPRDQPRMPALGLAAGRPRRPRTSMTSPPPANCSPCSTPTSPGTLRPMLRAERDLARARLAAGDGDRPPPRPSPPRSAACAN